VGLKDEVEILLEIKNISLSMNDIPAGARIQVTGGIFYEPVLILLTDPIPLNRSKAMNFFLVPTGNAELHTLPDAISVKLFVKSVQIFSRDTGFEIEMVRYVKDLAEWKPKPPIDSVNIVVFGIMGAGKSTLINTLHFLWDRALQEVAVAWGSDSHVTLDNQLHKATHGFGFLDTRGLTMQNYLAHEFDDLIQPLLPRKIHTIIFVATFGDSFSSETMARLSGFISKAAQKSYSSILVVTRLDDADADERNESQFMKIKKRFSQKTGMSTTNIFCIDNSNPQEKSLSKDKILYGILMCALENANNYILYRIIPTLPPPAPIPHIRPSEPKNSKLVYIIGIVVCTSILFYFSLK